MRESYELILRKWEACERLANDPGATDGERENARTKAKQFRAILDAMDVQTTDVTDANYKHYVEQGRQAVKNIHSSQWALGALAYNVRIEYGKSQLQNYAEDIGAVYSTLRHYRATWLAWLTPQGRPESFSVAEALNSHPDRYKLVAQFPNLTVEQATELVRLHKGKPAPRASASASSQQQAAPLTLDQARDAYLGLALKLSKRERTEEALKILAALEIKMSWKQ